jgi:hypothetical protein
VADTILRTLKAARVSIRPRRYAGSTVCGIMEKAWVCPL